jgi:CcmD family protein
MHNAMMRRVLGSIALIAALVVTGPVELVAREGGASAAEAQAEQPPPQQQDEFVPIDQLPPQDQLPAAPLLVTAYSFVVLALFGYVLSVARRLSAVQRELDRLESDTRRSRP